MNNKCTHLLWTGGWDSTFRLLQLILVEEAVVQPYYILIPGGSTWKEVDTMNNIRRKLFEQYPKTRELLKPIIFFDKRAIQKDPEIKRVYRNSKKQYPIRLQYKTFANFCRQFSIESMELGVLKSETVDCGQAKKAIFKYFNFPLLGYSKKEMAKISRERGWNEIMFQTWFCRKPNNGKPCGFCGPCTDVALSGINQRLPLKARLIAKVQLPFRKFWRNNYHLQSNVIFKQVGKLFKGKY